MQIRVKTTHEQVRSDSQDGRRGRWVTVNSVCSTKEEVGNQVIENGVIANRILTSLLGAPTVTTCESIECFEYAAQDKVGSIEKR